MSTAACRTRHTVKGESRLKYVRDAGFQRELRRRVSEQFSRAGLSPFGGRRMVFKTAALLAWFAASYLLLLLVAATWWQGLLLSGSLALAMAGVGFAVQHDANHGAYSRHDIVNRFMGMMLDLLGASSYLWHWKHNISHHTYPNLSGADDDIDLSPICRLSPAQPRYRLHALQHLYMWPLYGLLIPKWHFIYDFKNVLRGRIASNRFPRPRGWRLLQLVAGKLIFFSWAFAIPMLLHPWWVVLLFYGATAFLLGIVLSVVFQLAHCVEEAEFPHPPSGSDRLPDEWAVHQVQTTVDFAPRNRLVTWYVGGLNFQIEHHLFPKVCHLHYPRIARVVQEVCAEFGVRYTAHDRLLGAVASHWRWLRRMGRADVGHEMSVSSPSAGKAGE